MFSYLSAESRVPAALTMREIAGDTTRPVLLWAIEDTPLDFEATIGINYTIQTTAVCI
jgi:hypothetical protein